jgi:acyl-CoA dehydrogenase
VTSYNTADYAFFRLMVAARCLGAADRLTTEITAFAVARQVQGRPISELGQIQAMLADCLTELFAARSLTYETARGIDAGTDVKIQHAQCSMAKLYASEIRRGPGELA